MKIVITKGRGSDAIAITRADGTRADTTLSQKGPVPHDAVHWFVERAFALDRGFWGMVAAGHHPEDLLELAKAAGHASAKRAGVPDAAIVELLQAERIVECFEADLWSGGSGAEDDLLAMAQTACAASHVAMPAVPAGAVAQVREGLGRFAREWMAGAQGHTAQFDWEEC